MGGKNSEDFYAEYSIVAKRDKFMPTVTDGLRNLFAAKTPTDLLSIVEFPGFKPQQAIIEVELNGKTRQIDVRSPNDIRSYFDITGVKLNADGHPVFEDIRKISAGVESDLWTVLEGNHVR